MNLALRVPHQVRQDSASRRIPASRTNCELVDIVQHIRFERLDVRLLSGLMLMEAVGRRSAVPRRGVDRCADELTRPQRRPQRRNHCLAPSPKIDRPGHYKAGRRPPRPGHRLPAWHGRRERFARPADAPGTVTVRREVRSVPRARCATTCPRRTRRRTRGAGSRRRNRGRSRTRPDGCSGPRTTLSPARSDRSTRLSFWSAAPGPAGAQAPTLRDP